MIASHLEIQAPLIDEKYERMLRTVECISMLWRYDGAELKTVPAVCSGGKSRPMYHMGLLF